MRSCQPTSVSGGACSSTDPVQHDVPRDRTDRRPRRHRGARTPRPARPRWRAGHRAGRPGAGRPGQRKRSEDRSRPRLEPPPASPSPPGFAPRPRRPAGDPRRRRCSCDRADQPGDSARSTDALVTAEQGGPTPGDFEDQLVVPGKGHPIGQLGERLAQRAAVLVLADGIELVDRDIGDPSDAGRGRGHASVQARLSTAAGSQGHQPHGVLDFVDQTGDIAWLPIRTAPGGRREGERPGSVPLASVTDPGIRWPGVGRGAGSSRRAVPRGPAGPRPALLARLQAHFRGDVPLRTRREHQVPCTGLARRRGPTGALRTDGLLAARGRWLIDQGEAPAAQQLLCGPDLGMGPVRSRGRTISSRSRSTPERSHSGWVEPGECGSTHATERRARVAAADELERHPGPPAAVEPTQLDDPRTGQPLNELIEGFDPRGDATPVDRCVPFERTDPGAQRLERDGRCVGQDPPGASLVTLITTPTLNTSSVSGSVSTPERERGSCRSDDPRDEAVLAPTPPLTPLRDEALRAPCDPR